MMYIIFASGFFFVVALVFVIGTVYGYQWRKVEELNWNDEQKSPIQAKK